MRSFYEASQFIGGNHGDPLVALPAHDHNFMVIGHAVEHGGQTLA